MFRSSPPSTRSAPRRRRKRSMTPSTALCMEIRSILDADVVFFSRNGENDRVWGQIGDHVFCREYIWR